MSKTYCIRVLLVEVVDVVQRYVESRRRNVTRRAREWSVDGHDVERLQTLPITGDAQRDDLAVRDRELHDAARLTGRRPHETGETVDDREVRTLRPARERVRD